MSEKLETSFVFEIKPFGVTALNTHKTFMLLSTLSVKRSQKESDSVLIIILEN